MNKLIVVVSALLAVLAIPIASAHVTMYFDPQSSSIPKGYCNTTHVRIMANITSPDDLYAGQFAIYHNESCANITNLQWSSNIFQMLSFWNADSDCYGTNYDWIAYMFTSAQTGVVEICNLTIHCNCSSCEYCISPLSWSCGRSACYGEHGCPIQILNSTNVNLYLIPGKTTLVNGTVECGEPTYICGDVTGEGTVNMGDVTKLLWNQTYWGQYSVDPWAADVTGEGTVNMGDVTKLLWNQTYWGQYPLTCP